MLARYSHNSLNTFRDCPRKFKFHYVEKIELPERVTAELFLGNAVHRTLARLHQMASDGITWPLDAMLTFYHAEWEKPEKRHIAVGADYMTVDDHIRIGGGLLTTYHHKHHPFASGHLLVVERTLTSTLPGTPFQLTGRIDRVWKRPDGVVEICDYKTGKTLTRGKQDTAYFEQMGIYQLLVQGNYPYLEPIEVAEYFLRHDQIVRERFQPEDLDLLTEQLRLSVVEILHAERLDNFPAAEGAHCRFCEYTDLCPAKRHARLLTDEAGSSSATERTTAATASALANRFLAADTQLKQLTGEHSALKEELVRAARELSMEKFVGENGSVKVKLAHEEKFVTKSADPTSFADLVHTARELQLDDCFELSAALLGDRYKKERLTTEQIERLRPYLVTRDSSRVTAQHSRVSPEEPVE